MKIKSILSMTVLAAATAALLTACGSGTVIKDDGTTDEAKWHKWDSVTFNKDRGTFPNLQGLRQVRHGMTKDQLYELIGRPQYEDGWRPREWNYLFHFHTPGVGTDDVTTCQYMVLFDKDGFAQSFHWNPVDPADAACPPPEKKPEPKPVPVVVPPPAPVVKYFTVAGDALFDFDMYGVKDMNPEGVKSLDNIASEVKKFERLDAVIVGGHTDRLGSVAYNQKLSERRANTVKEYLVSKGIAADKITAIGYGKSQQVKACADVKGGQALRDCLHPNRRVTVEVRGYGTEKAE